MQDKEKSAKRDWLDIVIKVLMPVAAALLIAWAGYISERTLSRISSREESARLIIELQVSREQAESDLRKDVFDQALKAFFKDDTGDGGIRSLSKRLLRLELLALNFGDSLSLSPLFTEFKRDLNGATPIDEDDAFDHDVRIGILSKRLRSLAKRVASSQLSSVAQHGTAIQFQIPLLMTTGRTPCRQLLYDHNEYKWPDDEVKLNLESLVGNPEYQGILEREVATRSTIELAGVMRKVTLTFSRVDHCSKTVLVSLDIVRSTGNAAENTQANAAYRVAESRDEVHREFVLDYFNFPKIDNTRLSDNHRFAIAIEEFSTREEPHISITAVIFPAEYASLRDRPGMKEAMQLLQEALDVDAPQ